MANGSRSRVWPGRPHPLGATWDGQGVNIAVASEHATGVDLCLFDREDTALETERIPLEERTGQVWHAYLPDARPGLRYGFRVHGPWSPDEGHRFNPHKLLIDPYARALSGSVRWCDAVYGAERGDDRTISTLDSSPFVPRSVVVEGAFTWGDDRPPRIPWNRTLIYECHVKGLTRLHPDVPESLRGTYLGLATEPVLEHLHALGVTAVELLPVHAFVSEHGLVDRGLVNYWGYNSLGFFAPEARYASADAGEQVTEFKTMVKKLHAAGIEVILDVVYNHTAEGNHEGACLSLRGLDNASYYRLSPDDRRFYMDYTGCGNSLNVVHPLPLRMVMDSLRYWVNEMHVDGFRFDLAPVLGRGEKHGEWFDLFFDIVAQDPALNEVKLIAEPWDTGEGGYRLGTFPPGWAEWNGRYRDCIRRFWRGDRGQVAELASRLSGSSDLYRKGPNGSVNFVTCHDGFTLHDLVTYEVKRNEANGEDGGDGHHDNASRNWGVEGETADESVNALRDRMKRNILATLVLSQGVPMLTAGDELGRTQGGNNNAYCQDNETAWIDWGLNASQRELMAFVRELVALHRENPALRRRAFFHGGSRAEPARPKDVTWLRRDGHEMEERDWHRRDNHVLGMLLDGEASDEKDDRGVPLGGDTLLVLLNGGERPARFTLPPAPGPRGWTEILNTTEARRLERPLGATRKAVHLSAHTLTMLSGRATP